VSHSELPAFRAELAAPSDDPALRELLRARPMEGPIRVALEREPSFRQAQAIEGDRHYTVVVRDTRSGEIVLMGSRSVREVFVNDEPARLGYLGALRVAPGHRGFKRLAAGYREIESTRREDELPFDLTSVAAGNDAARRIFERGLPGLPRYRPLCEYRTLLIATRRRHASRNPQVEVATDEDLSEISACLARNLRRYQFAPRWPEAHLRCPQRCRSLHPRDFCVIREQGRIIACAAHWDQRGYKQVVIRGYSPLIARTRPALNLAFALTGRPHLPAVGHQLPLAYISHLAVDGELPELAFALVDELCRRSAGSDLEALAIGFAVNHPLLGCIERRYPTRTYRSRLYRVDWPGVPELKLEDRVPHVEVATL